MRQAVLISIFAMAILLSGCGSAGGSVDQTSQHQSDKTAPVIVLNGPSTMTLTLADVFVDPGAKASDDVDGEISDKIIVSGDVDTSSAGRYVIKYSVKDRAGNSASVTRTVIVLPKSQKISYTESDKIIKNPERGLYALHYLPTSDYSGHRSTPGRLGWIQSGKYTTFVEKLVLVDFKNSLISQSYLDRVDKEFDLIRKAGLKIILRVTYNEHMGEDDAPIDMVLKHIVQLKPILEKNKDIVMALEAGYIGAWGEWHSSTHDLTTPENMRKIKDALMQNVPKDIKIMFRRPSFLMSWYPEPLDEANMQSDKARAGFHDDCFDWNYTDMGTFSRDSSKREEQFSYLRQITKYLPVVGEMCTSDVANEQNSVSCESAMLMAQEFHYTMLGDQIRGSWTTQEKLPVEVYKEQGCWDELQKRLGYRFVLKSTTAPESVNSGGNLHVVLKITNRGFSATVNERAVYLILKKGNSEYKFKIDTDPREWYTDEQITLDIDKKLPKEMLPGRYDLYLWLPDRSTKLQNDPRYAIRLANEGVWDQEKGYNKLGSIDILSNSHTNTTDQNGTEPPHTSEPKPLSISSISLSKNGADLLFRMDGAFPKGAIMIFT